MSGPVTWGPCPGALPAGPSRQAPPGRPEPPPLGPTSQWPCQETSIAHSRDRVWATCGSESSPGLGPGASLGGALGQASCPSWSPVPECRPHSQVLVHFLPKLLEAPLGTSLEVLKTIFKVLVLREVQLREGRRSLPGVQAGEVRSGWGPAWGWPGKSCTRPTGGGRRGWGWGASAGSGPSCDRVRFFSLQPQFPHL